MRRTVLFSAALLLLPLLVACSPAEPNRPAERDQLSVGQTAPTFTLPSAAGGSVSLSDFRGRPVLLYFSMGPG